MLDWTEWKRQRRLYYYYSTALLFLSLFLDPRELWWWSIRVGRSVVHSRHTRTCCDGDNQLCGRDSTGFEEDRVGQINQPTLLASLLFFFVVMLRLCVHYSLFCFSFFFIPIRFVLLLNKMYALYIYDKKGGRAGEKRKN